MLATAIGSSEVLFWPWITTRYGFKYLWIALIALYLQYILNTEFARYTIATGESIITGFTRLNKRLAHFFLICSILPWIWPGWIMGAASITNWLLPVKIQAQYLAATITLLLGFAFSSSRIVYKMIELFQFIQTVFIVAVVIFFAVMFIRQDTISALLSGLTSFPKELPSGVPIRIFVTAIAFCGAGGTVNLATSNWVREKGLGMAMYIPKVVNPLTGKPVLVPSNGFFFEGTDENIIKWKKWWKLIKSEQRLVFLSIEAGSIVLLMSLAYALLPNNTTAAGIDIIKEEGGIINNRSNHGCEILFYIMVILVFLSSSIGVLDHVARLSSDILKNNVKIIRSSQNRFLSESWLYFFVLWGVITSAIVILLVANITDVPALLSLAGALSVYIMAVYSVLILVLHFKLCSDVSKVDVRFGRNNPFALNIWRKTMLVAAICFYGFLSWAITKTLF